MGQWLYSLFTDTVSKALQIAKRIYSVALQENDAALTIAAYRTLAASLYWSGDFELARQYAMRALEIWHSGDVPSQVEQVTAPAVACLYYRAVSEWQLGETASSKETMAEAISLAKVLNDVHGLAASLFFSCYLSQFEHNPAEVDRLVSEIIELSTRQNFALWMALGAVIRGWARSALGNPAEGIQWIEQGMRDALAIGSMLNLPYLLGLKAEALHLADRTSEAVRAIREAEALAQEREERWCSAELHRLRGVFLAAIGADEPQIEASFCTAIRIAREQKSVSWEKRAEATYAEYRRLKASGSRGRAIRLPL
jgi:predicted ATPase